MVSLNIASLLLHIDEIRAWLHNENVDFIALNETRLDSTIADNQVKLENYDIIRNDRNRNGGGVCVYLKNHINYRVRTDLMPNETEAIVIEILKPNSKPFIVISAYRPPCLNPDIFFEKISNTIKTLDLKDMEIFLLGDLNCDLLCTRNYRATSLLKSFSEVYQLEQLINEPTRCTQNTKTLIDVIYTNRPNRVVASGVLHLGISDHSLIYTIRKISIPNKTSHKRINIRNFKKFNANLFRNDLRNIPWENIDEIEDINDRWDLWKGMFLSVVDKHAPYKTKRIRNKKSPWMTPDIKKLLIERDKLKHLAVKTNNNEDWRSYKKARNDCNAKIKKIKTNYYQHLFKTISGNSKETWNSINELMSRKSKSDTISCLKYETKTISNPAEISEIFNKHFSEIGKKLSETQTPAEKSYQDYLQPVSSTFNLSPTTPSTIFKLLTLVPVNKGAGLDKIPGKLLKEAAYIISGSLCNLFNYSIHTSVFPDDWKLARVTPIYKNETKENVNNYRPISVLSCISKIFERIIYDQLHTYLNENNLLSSCQSGFRPLHSTSVALLDATTEWLKNMDQGRLNSVVFLDLAKAFDTVNHDILLDKLRYYGISPQSLTWFKSYLCNRFQICKVNGCLSSSRVIKCGVPQGSILGPLMFLVYINDLPRCMQHSTVRMYADDTNITTTGASLQEIAYLANQDLKNVNEWLKANKLNINATKTEHMFIGSDHSLAKIRNIPYLFLDGKPINRVRVTKSLGVYIDERLSWIDHIDHLSKKICAAISGLRQVKQFVPLETSQTIYKSLIQPLFDYCDVVWDNMPITTATRLQKLQNRAARVITSQGYEVRSSELIDQLHWKRLCHSRAEHMTIMMYKVLNNMAPSYLRDHFKIYTLDNTYALRNKEMSLVLPKPLTEYLKKTFIYRGVQIWNELPSQMRCEISLNNFKKSLSSLASSN